MLYSNYCTRTPVSQYSHRFSSPCGKQSDWLIESDTRSWSVRWATECQSCSCPVLFLKLLMCCLWVRRLCVTCSPLASPRLLLLLLLLLLLRSSIDHLLQHPIQCSPVAASCVADAHCFLLQSMPRARVESVCQSMARVGFKCGLWFGGECISWPLRCISSRSGSAGHTPHVSTLKYPYLPPRGAARGTLTPH